MRRQRLSSGAIRKKPREVVAGLVGRRVQVPQEVFNFVDPEPFFFGGTVKQACSKDGSLLIRFDYTGEEEWYCATLAKRWLEADLTPLCHRLGCL